MAGEPKPVHLFSGGRGGSRGSRESAKLMRSGTEHEDEADEAQADYFHEPEADSEAHLAANARHHATLQRLHERNARLADPAARVRIASFGGLIPRRPSASPRSPGGGSASPHSPRLRLLANAAGCASISPPVLTFSTDLTLGLTPMTQFFTLTASGNCPNTVLVLSFAAGGAGTVHL